jgi:short-subunit dehydrogenase
MVHRGAKNLVVLSRRGEQTKDAKAFLEEMHAAGARVTVMSCDISDACSLGQALKSVATYMPPIKGCIQAAMVVKASVFQSH